MGVYGMKEFKKECQGKLDAVVKCGTLDPKRLDGIKHFQRAADMKVLYTNISIKIKTTDVNYSNIKITLFKKKFL